MAIGAHPDDIEFLMAGTLLRLKEAGFEIHYCNVSAGNCGSMEWGGAKTARVRKIESQKAATILGATYHPSLSRDLEIVYNVTLLRRLAAVVRKAAPAILLIPSPQDYMEDHTNTCRLAVTAAFSRGMPNFATIPKVPPTEGEMWVYHAMPHGLRDGLRQRVRPELYVDTTGTHPLKREALGAHQSQKAWLDSTQGMNSYLVAMDEMSMEDRKSVV